MQEKEKLYLGIAATGMPQLLFCQTWSVNMPDSYQIRRNGIWEVIDPIFTGRPGIAGPPGSNDAAEVTYDGAYNTVKAALDSLLYLAPKISSFSLSASVVEIGTTLTEVLANWFFNKPMVSATLTDVTTLNPQDTSHDFISLSLTSDKTYTLTCTDAVSATDSSSKTVSFSHKRYWGVSANSSLNDSEIRFLSKEFSSSKSKSVTYDCAGGKYPYFCYPAAFGLPTGVMVGGLAFSDYTVSAQSFTNASGNTTTFNVVRFNNIQNGAAIAAQWN